ncbi:unnamed protein product, partial [Heterosigma akashiwo]
FFKSISLGTDQPVATVLQDTLSLIGLWFRYGEEDSVHEKMSKCLGTIGLGTWLRVVPQLIARIHTSSPRTQALLVRLLGNLGEVHPQALIYPVTVAARNATEGGAGAGAGGLDQSLPAGAQHPHHPPHGGNPALAVLARMRETDAQLVEESRMVSEEIQGLAITVHEMWHIAVEQASQFYFAEKSPGQMLDVLEGAYLLWDRLRAKGPDLRWTVSFGHAHGRDLEEARQYVQRYKLYALEVDLLQAWRVFFHLHGRLARQLDDLQRLRVEHLSPRLARARGLRLAVPGTYRPAAGGEVVRIAHLRPDLVVIPSKQRPRRLALRGSDGRDHAFLLKGREDLRQDERVVQLFGLVNALLNHDQVCNALQLLIRKYAVLPLSNNSGLIEWVPRCDTLHSMIKAHREAQGRRLTAELRAQAALAPDYDRLPLLGKLEVFGQVREQHDGRDLAAQLWLRSANVESWLSRRTNYTRSLAVMSMAGYILGLGDRHPSNLMIHQSTGQIVHIDFGDCFEVCQERAAFPEIVPFRLTPMLVNAMEVSGAKGTFQLTCDLVVKILRSNR